MGGDNGDNENSNRNLEKNNNRTDDQATLNTDPVPMPAVHWENTAQNSSDAHVVLEQYQSHASSLKVDEALNALPLWHRLHIRVAAAVFVAFFILTSAVAYTFYILNYRSDLAFLQQRLQGIVATLSQTIDGNQVHAFAERLTQGGEPQKTPYHVYLHQLFEKITAMDPDISTIYVLLPTNQPAFLRFYMDFDMNGGAAKIGQMYDASELPLMLQGFNMPTVEPKPFPDEYGISLSAYAPLKTDQGQVVGIVGADINLDRLGVMKKRVQHLALLLAGSTLVGVVLVAFFVGAILRNPLKRVMAGAQRVASGDLDSVLDIKRKDEFGVLADCFNRMVQDLKAQENICDAFGRYMSKKIMHALMQKGVSPILGGETCMVTIMFSDLKNYTRISESMSPQLLIETLNTYFGAMNEAIDAQSGCVIEFLGDGILAAFGAPFKRESHAADAVQAAIEMQKKLKELNAMWEKSGTAYLWQEIGVECIEMRIGIHTGQVVAGNMGSEKRMKYAVIGDTVNVASRLESLNNDLNTSVLISEEVRKELSPALKKVLRSCGEHFVKGRDKSLQVYTVIQGDKVTGSQSSFADTELIFESEAKQ